MYRIALSCLVVMVLVAPALHAKIKRISGLDQRICLNDRELPPHVVARIRSTAKPNPVRPQSVSRKP